MKPIRQSLVVCLLLLAGCSSGGNYDKLNKEFSTEGFSKEVLALGDLVEPYRGGKYKVGDPYTINGITYTPEEDFSYRETGIASWYGPGFHAKSTANGEDYDQDLLTAAHKTLPLPSFVRVTNLDNGRKVVLRVNDRGPFAEGRILDLSKGAAEALGCKNTGLARVRVEVIEEETRRLAGFMKANQGNRRYAAKKSKPAVTQREMATEAGILVPQKAPLVVERQEILMASLDDRDVSTATPVPVQSSAPPSSGIFIQAGAFSNADNAHRLKQRLDGLGPVNVVPITTANGSLYRVRLGPLADEASARRALDAAHDAGVADARLVAAQTGAMPVVKD